MNTKHRIFQDSDLMLNDDDLRLEKKRKKHQRKRSASYDFQGDQEDRDEQRRRKIEARKRNLIQQYKLSKDNWTRDTQKVLSELGRGNQEAPEEPKSRHEREGVKRGPKRGAKAPSPELKEPEWVMAEHYEDPRLTQMKHEMKMHEQLRRELRSKSPLKGDSTYEHDKRVRALRRHLNASSRSISGLRREQSARKVGHKKRGDFVKVNLEPVVPKREDSKENVHRRTKEPESQRSISPLKLKYDYQGSFRIGFEQKVVSQDER